MNFFEKAGTSIFISKPSKLLPILGLLNSIVGGEILKLISPTINCQVRDVFSVPVIEGIFADDRITPSVEQCINNTRDDWDSFETSWDFKKHPLF